MNSHMQPPPPPHFQHAEARPNASQSRSVQPNLQTTPTHKGGQNPYGMYDPQFAQWNFTKGKTEKISWAEVKPRQQHIELQSLQDEIERLRREGPSIKQAMKQIPSSNARKQISDLVEAQNRFLTHQNPRLHWTIAAIEVEFRDLSRRQKQLESIDVYLRTEPHIFVQANAAGGRMKAGNPGEIHDHRGNERMPNVNHFPRDQPMHPHVPNLGPIHEANMINIPRRGPSMGQLNEEFSQAQRQNQAHEEQLNRPQRFDAGHNHDQAHNQHQHLQRNQNQPHMQGPMQLPPPPPNQHSVRMEESMQPPPPLPNQHNVQPPPPPPNQLNVRMQESMQPPPPPPPPPNAGQHHGEHGMRMPPPPPPPPPPNAGQYHGEHGMGIPPPPPPPLGAPMPRQHNVSHHPSGLPPEISTSLPQPMPYPSMRHESPKFPEVLDPNILKFQKEKHRPPPTESAEETDSETCSDSDEPTSSSESFSAESIEDRSYDFIASRSRKPSGKKDKHGQQTRSRSQSRGRVPKLKKEKTPHRRANSVLDRSSIGPDSDILRRERPPKSSASPIPQQIHIHMATSTTRERDDDQRDSNSERLREREQYRNQTFEPERQRDFQDRVVKQRNHRRSPSSSPRLSYDKIERASAPSMSRGSSTDTYSDAVFTDETTSTFSMADDSVFSEPIRPQKASHTQFDVNDRKPLISRGWHRQADDIIYQDTPAHVVRDVDPRAVRHHPVDGFANSHLPSSRQHRSRPVIHSPDVIHDRWNDDHDYIASRPPQAHRPSVAAHRNSVQVPFPPEHDRYTPTRSVSYVAEPTQNYYSNPKTLPYPRDHPDVFESNASFEPFQEREMDAYTHIQHSQRKPLHRSNTIGGRVPSSSVDPWANRDYPPSDGYVERGYERSAGYRVGSHPLRMADGRVAYLQQR